MYKCHLLIRGDWARLRLHLYAHLNKYLYEYLNSKLRRRSHTMPTSCSASRARQGARKGGVRKGGVRKRGRKDGCNDVPIMCSHKIYKIYEQYNDFWILYI